MNISALAILIVASPRRVTFSAHAERLDRLLIGLSTVSNERLTATPELAGEIVAVSVHDAPLDQVMSKLADVTDGRWQHSDQTYFLSRSESALNSHRAKSLEQRKRKILSGIEERWKYLSDITTADNSGKTYPNAEYDRAFYKLTQIIGIDTLARIPRGGEKTFSSNPGPGEEWLAPAGIQLANEYWSRLEASGESPTQGPISKTAVVITCLDMAASTQFLLDIEEYDTAGQRCHSQRNTFGADYSRDWGGVDDAKKHGGTSLRLAPETSEFAQAYNARQTLFEKVRTSKADQQVLERVRNRLRHPEKIDPLWYASDILISFADARHLQFVGDLPDRLTDDSLDDLLKPESAALLAASLQGYASVTSETSDGWLTVTPREPDFTSANRVDRRLLADIGDVVAGTGEITLERAARLIQEGFRVRTYSTNPDSNQEIMDPAAIWAAFDPFPCSIPRDEHFLNFYASLSLDQLASAREANGLDITALSADQTMKLLAIINGDPYGREPVSMARIRSVRLTETVTPEFVTAIGDHYEYLSDGWFRTAVASPADLALALFEVEGRKEIDLPNTLLLRIGSARAYKLTIDVAGSEPTVHTLGLYSFPPKFELVPFPSLSPELRAQIDAELVKLRAKYNLPERKLGGP